MHVDEIFQPVMQHPRSEAKEVLQQWNFLEGWLHAKAGNMDYEPTQGEPTQTNKAE